jgi:hypothetical protein
MKRKSRPAQFIFFLSLFTSPMISQIIDSTRPKIDIIILNSDVISMTKYTYDIANLSGSKKALPLTKQGPRFNWLLEKLTADVNSLLIPVVSSQPLRIV